MLGVEYARINGSYSTALVGTYQLIELNNAGNYSKFLLRLYFVYTGGTTVSSSYSNFYLDGELKRSGGYSFSPGEHLLGEKEVIVYHESSGNYPGYNASISGNCYHFNSSSSGSLPSSNIPRYANFTQHYVQSKTINTVTIYWNANSNCDAAQYSINGGAWTGINGAWWPAYTITGLQPNTTYYIRTRIRRTDSGLWTESSNISITTYDIAKINSYDSVLLIGNNLNVKYTNLSNAKVEVGIFKTDGITPLVDYKEYDNNGIYEITESETKTLYKQIKNKNTYTARLYIKTTQNNISYSSYKDITIKATGNIKTVSIKKYDTVRKAIVYIKKEDKLYKALVWIKRNGKVMRCV